MSPSFRIAAVASAAVALLAPVASRPVAGQEPAEWRTLLVNVLDRQGRMIPGLDAARFRGESRGRAVEVLSAREDSSARRVAIVVDVSESQDGHALENAWRIVDRLVEHLSPRHGVIVLTVADRLRKHSELTSDRDALRDAVGQARARKARGPSALRDGVLEAVRAFSSPGPGNAVCMVTDGVDTASAVSPEDLVRAVAGTDVRVFVTETERLRPGGLLAEEARRWTRAVTEATGGLVVRVRASGTNEDAVAVLVSAISDAYRLEIGLPEPVDKPRRWKLEATAVGGERRKDVHLVFPRLLAPLAPR